MSDFSIGFSFYVSYIFKNLANFGKIAIFEFFWIKLAKKVKFAQFLKMYEKYKEKPMEKSDIFKRSKKPQFLAKNNQKALSTGNKRNN